MGFLKEIYDFFFPNVPSVPPPPPPNQNRYNHYRYDPSLYSNNHNRPDSSSTARTTQSQNSNTNGVNFPPKSNTSYNVNSQPKQTTPTSHSVSHKPTVSVSPQTNPKSVCDQPKQTIPTSHSVSHKPTVSVSPQTNPESVCDRPKQTLPSTPLVSHKPVLSRVASTSTKSVYNVVEKGSTPLYVVPEDIKDLIKRDTVPQVLRKPLSPETYKDYFAALLYAEDSYLEKWDGFEMKNVTLKLQKAELRGRKGKSEHPINNLKDDKIFVEFEVDAIPDRRPFLLSRDFAFVRPSGSVVDPFQGVIFRVVRSNIVLVEFGDDFHAQHYSSCKYDVTFSFNRVCLKRAHQAIAAASDMLFKKILFPDCRPKDGYFSEKNKFAQNYPFNSYKHVSAAIDRIITLNGPPAYLVEGPPAVTRDILSKTGMVVRNAVVQLCEASSHNRILICAPSNSTCDVFMRSLRKEVGDSNIFRANAAFRELDDVPDDIRPLCPYKEKEEIFSCPSLAQLLKFKVILSTFMSSYRLRNEGIDTGHFTHIFLVDASSAIEPEVLVPLTNLTSATTNIVVTGAPNNQSSWIRSKIARQNGLRTSYFERLRNSKCYKDLNPESITQLKDDSSSSSLYYT